MWTLLPELAARDEAVQEDLMSLEERHMGFRAQCNSAHDALLAACHAHFHPLISQVDHHHRPIIRMAEDLKRDQLRDCEEKNKIAIRTTEQRYKTIIDGLKKEKEDLVKDEVHEIERKKSGTRERHIKQWRTEWQRSAIKSCSTCRSSSKMYICGVCAHSYCTSGTCEEGKRHTSNRCPSCSKCVGFYVGNIYNANPPNQSSVWDDVRKEQNGYDEQIKKLRHMAESRFGEAIKKQERAERDSLDDIRKNFHKQERNLSRHHRDIIHKLENTYNRARAVYAVPCANREREIAGMRRTALLQLQQQQSAESSAIRQRYTSQGGLFSFAPASVAVSEEPLPPPYEALPEVTEEAAEVKDNTDSEVDPPSYEDVEVQKQTENGGAENNVASGAQAASDPAPSGSAPVADSTDPKTAY